ncbi:hypothetical protein AGMMS49543_06730 [Betaproteobacteria bacterium]|nr:hypothetical protein AGMMS49543_06730 [Betaproteobacteria bacterium]GHU18113.1 hypothetical protein AGMMS50243_07560 [Betaproteobacteria bacterium]
MNSAVLSSGQRFFRRVLGYARDGLVFIAIFALLGWTGSWHRIPELFAHFFLQYALALVCLGTLLLLGRDRKWFMIALVMLTLTGYAIAPFWMPADSTPASAHPARLSVLQFNVALQPEPLLRWLSAHRGEADVVLVLEMSLLSAAETKILADEFPYRIDKIDESPFSIALLSRYPLHEPQVLDLIGPTFPALQADIVTSGGTLRLVGIHPPPPIDAELAEWRNRFMTALASRLVEDSAPGRATLVFGDFNSTRWSPHLRDFMARTALSDAHRGQGAPGTWPAVTARYSGLLGIPMDMMLISPGVTVLSRHIGPDLGSDHLPVLTEIEF